MDSKLLLGLVSALGGGIFALSTVYLSGRFKMRQLEFKKMLQDSRTRLCAANNKLIEIYVPLISCAEKCFRNWYLYSKSKDMANRDNFFESIDKLRSFYENLINTGNIIYLVPEVREEMERLVRFLDSSKNAIERKLLILKRMEGIGIRSITEKEVRGNLGIFWAVICAFIIMTYSFLTKWFGYSIIRVDIEMRIACGPIDGPEFAEEFNRIMDVLRLFSCEIALYKDIVGTKTVGAKKLSPKNN